MLRIHCMQLLYTLNDTAVDDALYEIESGFRAVPVWLHS